MNTIAQNIKKMREDSKLSQQELAERIIVTRQTVSNWERGISQPDVELLSQVAVALNVELTDLIYDENQPVPELTKPQPASVKTAVILGALWLASLALLLFPAPRSAALPPGLRRLPLLDRVLHHQSCFLWTGWRTRFRADLSLGRLPFQNKLLRVVLLGIGFAISLLYPVLCSERTGMLSMSGSGSILLFCRAGRFDLFRFSWKEASKTRCCKNQYQYDGRRCAKPKYGILPGESGFLSIENALPMNMSRTFFICFCKKNPAQNLGVLTAERHVNGITQAGRLGNKKRIMK